MKSRSSFGVRIGASLSVATFVLMAVIGAVPTVLAAGPTVTPDNAFLGSGANYPLGIGTASNVAGDTVSVTFDIWLSSDCPAETKLFSWGLYAAGSKVLGDTVLETVDSTSGATTHLTGTYPIVTTLPSENFDLLVSISSSCLFYSSTPDTTLGLVVVPDATPTPTPTATPTATPTGAVDPTVAPTARPTVPATGTIATPTESGSTDVVLPLGLLLGISFFGLFIATRRSAYAGKRRRR